MNLDFANNQLTYCDGHASTVNPTSRHQRLMEGEETVGKENIHLLRSTYL